MGFIVNEHAATAKETAERHPVRKGTRYGSVEVKDQGSSFIRFYGHRLPGGRPDDPMRKLTVNRPRLKLFRAVSG
jgi:hypothetical protein